MQASGALCVWVKGGSGGGGGGGGVHGGLKALSGRLLGQFCSTVVVGVRTVCAPGCCRCLAGLKVLRS
jgi:hypothetical protein